MAAQLPQVEIVTASGKPGGGRVVPWKRSYRFRLFAGVFAAAMLVGQAINFLRPAVYRSSATVLTVAPPAIDQASVRTSLDLQHVAIQRQLMLGKDLLEATLRRLHDSGREKAKRLTSVAEFQDTLEVVPIPESHLVELGAQGADPQLLALLVNTWIEAYLQYREEAVALEVGTTLERLGEQYRELETALARKRTELEAFRGRHEILTEERSDNQAHARLKGLNDSLNDAREAAVNARLQLQSVEQAIAAGEPLVPNDEKKNVTALQVEVDALEEKLAEYDKRFTPQYRLVEPEFQRLPEQLKDAQRTLRLTVRRGQERLLAEAKADLQLIQDTVAELEHQLDTHKRDMAEFTARFTEQQGMVKDLEGLEEVYREIEQRIERIKSESLEKYPQVQVVDWAREPLTPLYPYYWRDALLVFTGSLLLAIVVVWVAEYLRRSPDAEDAGGTLSGVRIYADAPAAPPLLGAERPPPALDLPHAASLAAPTGRELTQSEVQALWQVADARDRRLIGLLLAGLNGDEIAAVDPDRDFDPARQVLHLRGAGEREIALSGAVAAVMHAPGESDPSALQLLAYDAGLAFPEQLDAAALRHTYVLFLVRQGARLREIERVVGPVSAQTLAGYGPYSPKGPGKALSQVDLNYPLIPHSNSSE